MENKPGIYIINVNDGLSYVGQSINVRKRKTNHSFNVKSIKSKKYNQIKYNKMRKYGYTFELIEYCDIDQLDDKERYYIKEYNTIYPNGYNFESGGNKNRVRSEYTKRKIGLAHKGKVISDKQKKILSEYAKKRIGDKNSFYGKKHSEESKKLMSEFRKGKYFGTKNPRFKGNVICIETGEIMSPKDFSYKWPKKKPDTVRKYIQDVANGKSKTAYGYTWEWVKQEVKQ